MCTHLVSENKPQINREQIIHLKCSESMKNKQLKRKTVVLTNFVSRLRELSTNEFADRNKFHSCTNFLLLICMFFGLFPLHGIRDGDVKHLGFRWKSPMVFHSIFLICSGLIISLGNVPWLLKNISMQTLSKFCKILLKFNDKFGLYILVTFVLYLGSWCDHAVDRSRNLNCNFMFFFRGFLTGIMFFRLAQKWPNFLRKFESVEIILSRYPPSKNIRKQLQILNGIVLFHGLEEQGDILLGFERFFVHYSYGYMFDLMPYTLVGGLWIQYTNVNLTFSWTFVDMFICSTSIIIASKIYQISSRVRQLISKEVNLENDWRIVREDFSEIFQIFKEYNRLFNPLLLLSYTVNIYFLLVQLFGAMKYPFTPASFMYYIISFGLLVTRLISVSIGGAKIHEESQELTTLLATVPSFIYNNEIKRFLVHLKICPTILSVDDYFQASKRTMLKIFGALVAYEIILIQFDKELVT